MRAGRNLFCFVLILFLLMALPHPMALAEDEQEQQIVITVVEQISADEIEDEEVPLAAFPAATDRDSSLSAWMLCSAVTAAVIISLALIRSYTLRRREEAALEKVILHSTDYRNGENTDE